MNPLLPWVVTLGLAVPAAAHDEVLPPRDQVSFQVEAVRESANDWATARLQASAEGPDPVAVADEVNRHMRAAIERSKRAKEIEVSSGSYTTQPVYENRRIVRWRASQELRLESADVDALSALIGELQGEGLTLAGIHFSVARETRGAIEDELIQEALAAFQARARLIAQGMQFKSWSLVNMSFGQPGGGGGVYRAQAEAMVLSRAAAPPALESGTSEIRVSIHGTITLE